VHKYQVLDPERLAEEVRASRLPPPLTRRRLREAAGLSLHDVGQAVGVSAMSVLRWERGGEPTRQHAIVYRKLLVALDEATR
jgi:DNA-binding transcriptional regulator YiaG